MLNLSVQQLKDNLLSMKGAAIVTIHAQTAPPVKKTGNPYQNVVKHSDVNGVINWVYEPAVNRQRIRENLVPDFKAYPRKWGQRIYGTPLVEHNGNYYLEMKVQSSNCRYYVGYQEVSHADITPWLRPISPTRQGVTREIILRDYALENIKGITYGNDTYTISCTN